MSLDIVDKSGAWYSFQENRIGQGRNNVRRFLIENTDIRDQISDLIREKTGLTKKEEGAGEKPAGSMKEKPDDSAKEKSKKKVKE